MRIISIIVLYILGLNLLFCAELKSFKVDVNQGPCFSVAPFIVQKQWAEILPYAWAYGEIAEGGAGYLMFLILSQQDRQYYLIEYDIVSFNWNEFRNMAAVDRITKAARSRRIDYFLANALYCKWGEILKNVTYGNDGVSMGPGYPSYVIAVDALDTGLMVASSEYNKGEAGLDMVARIVVLLRKLLRERDVSRAEDASNELLRLIRVEPPSVPAKRKTTGLSEETSNGRAEPKGRAKRVKLCTFSSVVGSWWFVLSI